MKLTIEHESGPITTFKGGRNPPNRSDKRPTPPKGSKVTSVISSLDHPNITLKKPIPISIFPDGNEFVACFKEANIATGGESIDEAFENITSLICDFFGGFYFIGFDPDEQLSPSMDLQKRILESHLAYK